MHNLFLKAFYNHQIEGLHRMYTFYIKYVLSIHRATCAAKNASGSTKYFSQLTFSHAKKKKRWGGGRHNISLSLTPSE